MCGISLTLVCRSSAASPVTAADAALRQWGGLAERTLRRRGPDSQRSCARNIPSTSESPSRLTAIFTGAVLHLRGAASTVTVQPLEDAATGNVLCWNGEAYSIDHAQLDEQTVPPMEPDQNDTEYILALISSLPSDTFAASLTRLMAAVDGPFSFVLYHAASQTIWYGRDKLGRRSLVTARRMVDGEEVIHVASLIMRADDEATPVQWEEVSTSGIWCIHATDDHASPFELRHSAYPHVQPLLPPIAGPAHTQLPLAPSFACGLHDIDPTTVAPYVRLPATDEARDLLTSRAASLRLDPALSALPPVAQLLYDGLYQSMSKRVGLLCTPSSSSRARVGVLFSGGIDCMVLARLAHRLLPAEEPIDLINVAFCGELRQESINKFVPDRVTAINGWRELKRCSDRDAREQAAAASASTAASSDAAAPVQARRWNLIQVNVSLRMLERHRAHITSLLQPNSTCMDFNIGSVLWFGTMGKGILYEETTMTNGDDETNNTAQDQTSTVDEPATVTAPSRLHRLGGEKPSTGANATKSKIRDRDRVLPPELIAKLELLRASVPASEPAYPSTSENDNGPASEASSASLPMPQPSTSPEATSDADDADPATADLDTDSLSPAEQKRISKAERKTARRREQKMIRAFFKKADRRAHDEALEEILPTADDFLPIGDEDEYDMQYEEMTAPDGTAATPAAPTARRFYTSAAKVLLIGIGADEQLAGYGRHRTVWSRFGATGLANELARDFARIWSRNLGRDDRLVSDSGREARHPFLDESLVRLIHDTPLDLICDLALPPGVGDKRALRQVAHALGLEDAARLVKRAMQFGSRFANKKVSGHIALSESVDLREIVNPFFLRANTQPPASDSRRGVAPAPAYHVAPPLEHLSKKAQKKARAKTETESTPNANEENTGVNAPETSATAMLTPEADQSITQQ